MDIYLAKKKIRLDPSRSIGKGGEADVFDIGEGKALKVYKQPTHPDYDGLPHEQVAAKARIHEHQKKLPAFPHRLPPRVIVPGELAYDRSGKIVSGYSMQLLQGAQVLLKYADKTFRQGGVSVAMVLQIFRDLHATLNALHQAGVVIGDFNDLNVLVKGMEAYLIDADSFQFGPFLCRVFTSKFVDPLRCDPKGKHLMLNQPHNENSDWYAYDVMLMQCLTFTAPFGGVYRPKQAANRMTHDERPLHRISVFHPEVIYPKPAIPLDRFPDELLESWRQRFDLDQRGEFPLKLLVDLRWTKCTQCGTEHARRACPVCTHGVTIPVVTVRGKVTAKYSFRTEGVILCAAMQGAQLRFVYHEGGEFKREDGATFLVGRLDPYVRYRISGGATLLGKENAVAILQPGMPVEQLHVDRFGQVPLFDTNEQSRYWVEAGRLLRNGALGAEYIGDVLSGQTLFWAGETFGFGFYRASNLSVAFVFDAMQRGINDSVKLPVIRGHLVDATCRFTNERCWFLFSTREGGQAVNRCVVIRRNGNVEAVSEAPEGDGSWLGTLRGKCVAGNFLLAATDDGLVRVEVSSGQIVETKRFPDAEPFVDTSCHLFLSKQGLYVVARGEVRLLQIS